MITMMLLGAAMNSSRRFAEDQYRQREEDELAAKRRNLGGPTHSGPTMSGHYGFGSRFDFTSWSGPSHSSTMMPFNSMSRPFGSAPSGPFPHTVSRLEEIPAAPSNLTSSS
jgi:hypothetical protein